MHDDMSVGQAFMDLGNDVHVENVTGRRLR